MIVWELSTTDGDNTSYRYFVAKGEASKAKRAFKKKGIVAHGPEKIKVVNRDDLIALIAQVQGTEVTDDDDAASEFL